MRTQKRRLIEALYRRDNGQQVSWSGRTFNRPFRTYSFFRGRKHAALLYNQVTGDPMQTKTNDQFKPTRRTTLKRLPKRASYERKIIYDILDEGFICHLGFVDSNHPVVIPTAYGRVADLLYIH